MKKILLVITILLFSFCSITPQTSDEDRQVTYIESDGAYIPVLITGVKSKKTIIFVHGGPGLSGQFYFYMPFLQDLSTHYRIVYWDQRGAGGSRGKISATSITIPQFVKDMDAVYQFVKLKYPDTEIYVMGHSYGGMVGAAYSAMYNDKVKASILLSPAYNIRSITYAISPLMLEFIKSRLEDPKASEKEKAEWLKAEKFYKNNPRITASQFLKHVQWTSKRDDLLGLRQEKQFTYEIIPTLLFDNIVENTEFIQERIRILEKLQANKESERELSSDPVFGLEKITHPVFVAHGKLDYIVPLSTVKEGYDKIGSPSKEFYEMQNSTHAIILQPGEMELFEKVVQFIEKY